MTNEEIHERINDDESNVCACCGYPAEDLKAYDGPMMSDGSRNPDKVLYCGICAGTFLSQCVTYPALLGQHRYLFSSIGWIGNRLLEEMKEIKDRLYQMNQ